MEPTTLENRPGGHGVQGQAMVVPEALNLPAGHKDAMMARNSMPEDVGAVLYSRVTVWNVQGCAQTTWGGLSRPSSLDYQV